MHVNKDDITSLLSLKWKVFPLEVGLVLGVSWAYFWREEKRNRDLTTFYVWQWQEEMNGLVCVHTRNLEFFLRYLKVCRDREQLCRSLVLVCFFPKAKQE